MRLNCLRPYHVNLTCAVKECRHCGRKHHSFLYIFNDSVVHKQGSADRIEMNSGQNQPHTQTSTSRNNNNLVVAESVQVDNGVVNPNVTLHCQNEKATTQVIKATALLDVYDCRGNTVRCPLALLNGGSQSNFLGIQMRAADTKVSAINKSISNSYKMVNAEISYIQESFNTKELFLLYDKITDNLLQVSFDLMAQNLPNNVYLANNRLNISHPIDILLGVNGFYNVLCVGQIKLGTNLPVLQRTKFVWVVSGNFASNFKPLQILCNLSISDNDLYQQLEKFWKIEIVILTIL